MQQRSLPVDSAQKCFSTRCGGFQQLEVLTAILGGRYSTIAIEKFKCAAFSTNADLEQTELISACAVEDRQTYERVLVKG